MAGLTEDEAKITVSANIQEITTNPSAVVGIINQVNTKQTVVNLENVKMFYDNLVTRISSNTDYNISVATARSINDIVIPVNFFVDNGQTTKNVLSVSDIFNKFRALSTKAISCPLNNDPQDAFSNGYCNYNGMCTTSLGFLLCICKDGYSGKDAK